MECFLAWVGLISFFLSISRFEFLSVITECSCNERERNVDYIVKRQSASSVLTQSQQSPLVSLAFCWESGKWGIMKRFLQKPLKAAVILWVHRRKKPSEQQSNYYPAVLEWTRSDMIIISIKPKNFSWNYFSKEDNRNLSFLLVESRTLHFILCIREMFALKHS